MAYINKEEIRQAIEQLKNDTDTIGILGGINRVGSAIASLPTADVVEIPCRCEKCKYHKTHTCAITGHKTFFCDYGEKPVVVEPTHYCGYGERRNAE